MIDVAISTMWGIGRFPSLAGFFEAARAIGLTRFELNHAVTGSMLKGLRLNGYRIPSVHEPCPADPPVSELKRRNWFISAPEEENRQQGIDAVKRSIDLALGVGAEAIVVHPGQVDIDPALDRRVVDLFREGSFGTAEYLEARDAVIRARTAQAPVNLDSVRRSLKDLADYAGQRGLKLGLENRYHYFEIPSPDELGWLLEGSDSEIVGYWYDVGHAHTMDRLGFFAHTEWLPRFSSRMIGMHLHDVVGIDDHRAAGAGEVNWQAILPHLPARALRTCEFQNHNSPEQVAAGVQWLIDRGVIQRDGQGSS